MASKLKLPQDSAVLRRNGYARLSDLADPRFVELLSGMESFQAEFVAGTRPVWRSNAPFTGDTLYNFSRQWEYPYVWTNLGTERGSVLDAGSGMTFFPFLLAREGFEVHCCDAAAGLDAAYQEATTLSGLPVSFSQGSIAAMKYADSSFDVVVCISVLEHLGSARKAVVAELARVLKPGGRLVLTCDLSLSRDCDTVFEDLALILSELEERFGLSHPLNLYRPPDLLTSDHFLRTAPWRLPWRPFPKSPRNIALRRVGKRHFHSVAVLGLTAEKRAVAERSMTQPVMAPTVSPTT